MATAIAVPITSPADGLENMPTVNPMNAAPNNHLRSPRDVIVPTPSGEQAAFSDASCLGWCGALASITPGAPASPSRPSGIGAHSSSLRRMPLERHWNSVGCRKNLVRTHPRPRATPFNAPDDQRSRYDRVCRNGNERRPPHHDVDRHGARVGVLTHRAAELVKL
jgi:hypothetical protein